MEIKFANELCNCLIAKKIPDSVEISTSILEKCIQDSFIKHQTEVEKIVNEFNTQSDITPYEKVKIYGVELYFNILDSLLGNCHIFFKSINNFKANIFNQIKISNDSIENVISEMLAIEKNITDPKKLASY